jgi:hypothetical protein
MISAETAWWNIIAKFLMRTFACRSTFLYDYNGPQTPHPIMKISWKGNSQKKAATSQDAIANEAADMKDGC